MTQRRTDVRLLEQTRGKSVPEAKRPVVPAAWLRCSAALEIGALRRNVEELEAIERMDHDDRHALLAARADLDAAELLIREGVPGWAEIDGEPVPAAAV